MPDPNQDDRRKSLEGIGSAIADIIESFDAHAAVLLRKEIEPDLLAACAVGHLAGHGPDFVRLQMNEGPLTVLISGIVVIKGVNARFEDGHDIFASLRSGANSAAEASLYSKYVALASKLFPNLPPDITLDTLVRKSSDFSELLEAMRQYEPAEKHLGRDRSDLREFKLSHAQLKLLADSTSLLQELRKLETGHRAGPIWHEQMSYSAIRLLATLAPHPEQFAKFLNYADPPLDYAPSADAEVDVNRLIQICMEKDAYVRADVALPPKEAIAFLRAGVQKQQFLGVHFEIDGKTIILSFESDGSARLITHYENREQALLDEVHKRLQAPPAKGLFDPPVLEGTCVNIQGIWLQCGTLKPGTTFQEVIEATSSIPGVDQKFRVADRRISIRMLHSLAIKPEDLTSMGVSPSERGEFMQSKLFGLMITADERLKQKLGTTNRPFVHRDAELELWRAGYRASVV